MISPVSASNLSLSRACQGLELTLSTGLDEGTYR